MEWVCPHCKQLFVFEKHQQKGGHLTNCKENPKRQEIDTKNSKSSSLPRIEIFRDCKKCGKRFSQFRTEREIETDRNIESYCGKECSNYRVMTDSQKELAVQLRELGRSIGEIANEIGASRSTVSLLVRGVSLTEEQRKELSSRGGKAITTKSLARDLSRANTFRKRREEHQNRGRERIHSGDSLYLAGCMLYWGEGSKGKNDVRLVNSDPAMLLLFKRFLVECFGIDEHTLRLTINCYTDLHSLEEIEKFWFDILGLTRQNLRKGQVNNLPKSSKNSKVNKSEWGTVSLQVGRTDVVQEIFGAIQEYAAFDNKKWLG